MPPPGEQERAEPDRGCRHLVEVLRRERSDQRPEGEGRERDRAEPGREPLADPPDDEREREEDDPAREQPDHPDPPASIRQLVRGREPERLHERKLDEREPRRLVRVLVSLVEGMVEAEAAVVGQPPVGERLAEAQARVVLRVQLVDGRERTDGDECEHQQLQSRLGPWESRPHPTTITSAPRVIVASRAVCSGSGPVVVGPYRRSGGPLRGRVRALVSRGRHPSREPSAMLRERRDRILAGPVGSGDRARKPAHVHTRSLRRRARRGAALARDRVRERRTADGLPLGPEGRARRCRGVEPLPRARADRKRHGDVRPAPEARMLDPCLLLRGVRIRVRPLPARARLRGAPRAAPELGPRSRSARDGAGRHTADSGQLAARGRCDRGCLLGHGLPGALRCSDRVRVLCNRSRPSRDGAKPASGGGGDRRRLRRRARDPHSGLRPVRAGAVDRAGRDGPFDERSLHLRGQDLRLSRPFAA